MINFKEVDKSWTLFLDRDGVINKEVLGDYVLKTSQFFFYDETLIALEILNRYFGTIVIVTNQKGVGRGVMTQADLDEIHDNMMKEIVIKGGRIDKIYFATDLENDSPYRKPQIGMALHADRVVVMANGRLLHHGRSGDAATHTALVDVFDQRISIHAIEGQWVALPKNK